MSQMSTKPEAGQWWFPNNVKPGRSANQRGMFIIGYTTNGDVIGQTSRDGAVTSWSDVSGYHHEPRCTGWDWVVPQPAEDSREFLAGPKGVEVIGEDPDEWVIQDRVPVRVGDRGWWENARFPLPLSPEQMVPVDIECDEFKHGLRHGYTEKHLRNATFHVYCRRRDLPQPEPQQQKPVSDEALELVAHLRDQMQVLANRVAECERVVSAHPQPQKTRVRLWKNNYGSVMSNDDCEHLGWQEIHHDADGFYVEDQSRRTQQGTNGRN